MWRYVYRAVDQHGQIIDVYVSKRRNIAAVRVAPFHIGYGGRSEFQYVEDMADFVEAITTEIPGSSGNITHASNPLDLPAGMDDLTLLGAFGEIPNRTMFEGIEATPRWAQLIDTDTLAGYDPHCSLADVLSGEASLQAGEAVLSDATLLAPVERPGKVIYVGINYLDHCRETNRSTTKPNSWS